jgi:hypothetical protein
MKERVQLLNRHIICFDFILILKILAEKLQTEQLNLVIAKTILRATCNILYALVQH